MAESILLGSYCAPFDLILIPCKLTWDDFHVMHVYFGEDFVPQTAKLDIYKIVQTTLCISFFLKLLLYLSFSFAVCSYFSV